MFLLEGVGIVVALSIILILKLLARLGLKPGAVVEELHHFSEPRPHASKHAASLKPASADGGGAAAHAAPGIANASAQLKELIAAHDREAAAHKARLLALADGVERSAAAAAAAAAAASFSLKGEKVDAGNGEMIRKSAAGAAVGSPTSSSRVHPMGGDALAVTVPPSPAGGVVPAQPGGAFSP